MRRGFPKLFLLFFCVTGLLLVLWGRVMDARVMTEERALSA